MIVNRAMKKSAIGANTVTLIPSTNSPDAHPSHHAITQIVITYAGTPPPDMWGTLTDGAEYECQYAKRT